MFFYAWIAKLPGKEKRARELRWLGANVKVLPLERIYASKKFVGRPNDIAHLPLLEQTIKLRRRLTTRRRT